MYNNLNEELFAFIKKSPTSFHAIAAMEEYMENAGAEKLSEGSVWNLKEGGTYYVTRNKSAIIAFHVPSKEFTGFNIAASHSDSPSL